MNAANPQAKSIFGQALAIDASAERAAYLEQACGGDAALRAEVESLLAALEGAGDFLKQPAAAPGATVDSEPGADQGTPGPSAAEAVGSRIGPYKLLQQLGEGGMGTVWVAEQTEPVKRRVALKVIKPGMDSAQVLRRFEAERQALAMMDHSHIARVFDAGTTATGRPYFVMELVKGVPITRYCDELHLPIRERLALFIPECQAIQHAHHKGIIHRDVKPSNVLVCIQDGQPVAKVIDFGIAKALHQKLSEQSLYTEIGQVVGTLQYMSPEQAELSALDIDTRADVYALGVLLYELLTGSTPLDKKRLQSVAILEVLRLIREEEPHRPSTRLTDSKESLASLAAQRRTEPGRLTKEVRGELDWIVMKCLEKDRTRRYEASSGLARDLEHYLHDEAVEACPPSTGYRLKKLLRRHKGPVAAAATVFLVLLAGVAVSTWQAVRALRAEGEVRQQRDKAAAVRDFLQHDLLMQADAGEQAERLRLLGGAGFEVHENPTIKELLERAAAGLTAEKIEQKFPQQPQVQAEVLHTVGYAFYGVGEYARAITHLQRAADLLRTHHGPDHKDTLTTLDNLALAYLASGRTSEAVVLFEKVRDARITKLGPDHPDTLTTLNNLALAYQDAGKTADAVALFEKVRDAVGTKLGPDHPSTLTTLGNLAEAYQAAGKTAEAIALFEKVRDACSTKLGLDHPHTLTTLNNLAGAYRVAGRTSEAVVLFEKVRDARITKLGPDHPDTLTALNNLAMAYWRVGKLERSVPLVEENLRKSIKVHGVDHPQTFSFGVSLAGNYRDAKRLPEAVKVIDEWLPRTQAQLGIAHTTTQFATKTAVSIYQASGLFAKSAAVQTDVLAFQRKQLPPDDPGLADTLVQHGWSLLKAGKSADAEPILRECLAIREKKEPDAWTTFNTRSLLGGSLLDQKKYADAEPLLLAGYEGMKQREAKIPASSKDSLTEALERLVQLYEATDKKDKADQWRKKLEEAKAFGKGPSHP